MVRRLFAAAGIAALGIGTFVASAAPPAVPAQNYNLDPVHSSVLFRVKRFGFSNFYAMFEDLSGKIALDPMSAGACTVELEVKADSVDSRNEKRNQHLKSPDFFNAKEFPTISFKSTRVAPGKDEDTYEVTGNLTLHGVTKPVTVVVRKTGEVDDPQKAHRAAFETSFKVKRSDFGMNYGLAFLSDEVEMMVAAEAIRQ